LIVDVIDLIEGLPAADAATPPSAGYEKTPRAGGVAALTMVPTMSARPAKEQARSHVTKGSACRDQPIRAANVTKARCIP
jgi:hypothetical protein